jgi:hypothetical protein
MSATIENLLVGATAKISVQASNNAGKSAIVEPVEVSV